ncbi:crossover junction endodeoxyribonuclease RuvC [Ruficoccus amylovorans]|uniref:Crossover junction endodeoxyribonuclease RuvC n=1 Tax=Ruficoccus amylovorans TaxID=1804625 RepID=A0A842HCX6_9BACT|nr:crossover junction endodeoxyribonuclease RuvC [Ruficoccus amylovorans]MBC2594049.1 crossover junction endodeoxyribonuclease RuvC [Ruficoccus amylovorans]
MARKSSRNLWTAKLTGKPVPGASSAPVTDVRRVFAGVVLGIDPSLRGTGLALVEFAPGKQPRLLASETVRNRPKLGFAECLGVIAHRVSVMLEHDRPPVCVALEQTIYVQNFQTAQILGAARGAAIAPAAMRSLPVFEYAPLRIKQAVVGAGRASKEQVASMMRHHLQLLAELPSDESDAAATACCHAWTWHG